jgi:outer membrane usher protein FimD/PapC
MKNLLFKVLTLLFFLLSVSCFGKSYISVYHERDKDNFKGSSIDVSYAVNPKWNLGVSVYRGSTDEDKTKRNEVNTTYTIDESWLDIRGGIRTSEEPNELKGKGASIGAILQVNQLWNSFLATSLILDFYYTKYEQEESLNAQNFSIVFNRDFSQKDYSITLEQELTENLVLGLEHGFSRYNDVSLLTGTSSRFTRLNFATSASGINGYPDHRWGGYLQYYLTESISFELNYSEVESNEVDLNTANSGFFTTYSFDEHVSVEASYFKVKSDILLELYGLRFSYHF